MQLLSKFSEENGLYEGLGLIPGCVKKIKVNRKLKIPHVGWNNIFINKKKPILENIDKLNSFYFVHSFSFRCDQKYISSTTSYGCKIISSVQNKHIFGVQFHPEKSQKNGEKIINNFIKYCYK